MKASFANIKKRYCTKLGEQVLWDDDDLVPVQGNGIGPRDAANSARARKEGHALGERVTARTRIWDYEIYDNYDKCMHVCVSLCMMHVFTFVCACVCE